jgi:NAD(P)-dependent dehydrogenase (short-subunit alcohol dehydrogenase family)
MTVHCRNRARRVALDLGSTPGSEIASYAALMDGADGRTAIVTSAASGIGLALASALAAAGSRVLMTDIDGAAVKAAATWVQANGGLVEFREVDVRDEDAVQQAAQRAVEQFGALHIVVNNVNTENRDTRWKQPLDELRDALDVRGLVHGIRGFVPHILESCGGHVVNIAPVAVVVPYQGVDPCMVSQNAVLGISEVLRVVPLPERP